MKPDYDFVFKAVYRNRGFGGFSTIILVLVFLNCFLNLKNLVSINREGH